MSIRRESRQEAYDVIVVGSGMGGLSAAALMAKAGKKVLVVERHDRPGGYAQNFKRKNYLFDAAIHLTGGCEPTESERGGLIDGLLRLLGVRDRCTFLPLNPFYTAIFPEFKLSVPVGVEECIEAHIKHFPGEEKGFRNLVGLCSQVAKEARQFPPQPSLWDTVRASKRFPNLFKYRRATLGKVMNEYITDARLKAVFSTLWPYLGLPPSRLSFLFWAGMLMSFVQEGAFYCQGSFQNLASALAEAIESDGGEVLLRNLVRRILVLDRRVQGVMLENGQRIRAPVVVSNADAVQTFEALVGIEHLPGRFVKGLRRLKPSISAFVVYLATDLDLRQAGVGHETMIYKSWHHDEIYQNFLEGKPSGVGVTVPTLTDPSLAPPGEHLVIATTLIPYEIAASWREEKARYRESLLEGIEPVIPGLRDRITFVEGASPRTMERYTLNSAGAMYGWEASPEQAGRNRLGHQTPVSGLYLSGHWTQPGGGIYAVILSGLQTAQIVLGYRSTGDFIGVLQPQSM